MYQSVYAGFRAQEMFSMVYLCLNTDVSLKLVTNSLLLCIPKVSSTQQYAEMKAHVLQTITVATPTCTTALQSSTERARQQAEVPSTKRYRRSKRVNEQSQYMPQFVCPDHLILVLFKDMEIENSTPDLPGPSQHREAFVDPPPPPVQSPSDPDSCSIH